MSQPSSRKSVSADLGEDMNVRHVHAAIWREEAEPVEFVRRLPALLKHFYFVMFLWLLYYLATWMGGWKWNEYEVSPVERGIRDQAHAKAEQTNPPR